MLVLSTVDTVRDAPETFAVIVAIALLAVVLDLVWKRMRAVPDASAGEPEPTASAGG